jgi:hypothetical protein
MSEQQSLHRQLDLCRRRLGILSERQAAYGLATPPEVLIEIEDLEKQIARLQERLRYIQTSYHLPVTHPPKTNRVLYIAIALALVVLAAIILTVMVLPKSTQEIVTSNTPSKGIFDGLLAIPTVAATTSSTSAKSTAKPGTTKLDPNLNLEKLKIPVYPNTSPYTITEELIRQNLYIVQNYSSFNIETFIGKDTCSQITDFYKTKLNEGGWLDISSLMTSLSIYREAKEQLEQLGGSSIVFTKNNSQVNVVYNCFPGNAARLAGIKDVEIGQVLVAFFMIVP